jgi:hypothetical protein
MNNARRLLATLLLGAIACMNTGTAQTIPNGGFEDWPDGVLTGWDTSNDPPTYLGVTKSTDAHSGSFAVLGTVVDAGMGFGIPPTIFTAPGFPLNSRPAALHGWYKSSLSAGDFIHISVALFKGEDGVGAGSAIITSSSASYKEFAANIVYISEMTPDTAVITMNLIGSAGFPTIGSSFLADDLAWGVATAVKSPEATSPEDFRLDQNYPNPFNPNTTIAFAIAGNGHEALGNRWVKLAVYDLLGREVALLVDEMKEPGNYTTTWDASRMSSGVYYYRLTVTPDGGNQSQAFVQTKMMTLMR